MTDLFHLFTEFCNQMTLGSNKTRIFNVFAKNETKKRKSNEEMNGFMGADNLQSIGLEDNHNDPNIRFQESRSYETPSKRARIEVIPNQEIMSSEDNSTQQNNRSGGVMAYLQNSWNRFKGKQKREVNPRPENTPVPPVSQNSVTNNELMPSSSRSAVSHVIQTNAINQTIVTNESLSSNVNPLNQLTPSFAKSSSKESRKRPLAKYFKLNDKMRYQQLLSRHTPLASHEKPITVRQEPKESPPVIDLTSEKSFATITSIKSSAQTSQQLYKTEVLDNSSKVNIVDRIRNKGTVAPALTTSRPLFSNLRNKLNFNPFSSKHSTPKFNLFEKRLPETEARTPETSERNVSMTELPESSKKFNQLIQTKKDYLNSDFISDLRSSLLKSTELKDKSISKSESFLNECQIKRVTDCQSLGVKLKPPITRTELLPFIPYIEYNDIIEEEDEDEEEEEEEDEESAPYDFPVLTPDMNREIDAALKSSPPDDVLCEGFTMQICRKDMETLKGLNWLNDEIINFYLSLIVERGKNDNFPTVHAFNTFFYKKLKDNGAQSLKRWTRKVDVFANDFIFIPIHLGMHWCLAVIDFCNKKIEYYDSMGGTNTECVHALKAWLQTESLDKKKKEFPMTDWSLQMAKDIPQQMNGSDCGMFSCKYAEYISRNARINFTQAHMPYFRRRMVYEILTKQLL